MKINGNYIQCSFNYFEQCNLLGMTGKVTHVTRYLTGLCKTGKVYHLPRYDWKGTWHMTRCHMTEKVSDIASD